MAPLGCAAYGIAVPESVLVGGLAWLVVMATGLAGYGHVAERLVRARVDVGLRLAWGVAAFVAVAGWLLAVGALDRMALAVLLAAGVAASAWRELRADVPTLIVARRALPALRGAPHTTALIALIAAIATLNVVAAVARQHGNVYDDDVIYTPMVQRLLDVGDLDEPFSFRRISAYGGHTVLQALGPLRGTHANLFLLDGAFCQLLFLLLLVGVIRRPRPGGPTPQPPVDALIAGLVLLVAVLLPDTAINTASYWSGAALFLALYRTFALTSDDASPRLFAAVGVVSAAIGSLRQNFLPVVSLFVVLVMACRLFVDKSSLRAELPRWRRLVVAGLFAIAPYCVATWRSNDTFLYPLIDGTFNPDIQMQPALGSVWQELQLFARMLLEPEPFRAGLVLLPVLLVARDRRAGRPLTAFTIAAAVGFVLLVHNFTLSDTRTLWRYLFGFTMPLVLLLGLEGAASGLERNSNGPIEIPLVGRVVIVVSLLVQLALSGRGLANEYDQLGAELAAAVEPTAPPGAVAALYRDLQSAAPAGAPIAVLLDEPVHLDYRRNRILNLDLPGFASYRPGMPYFRGHQPVIEYLRAQGIRYLAFVRGDASRYMYRRDYWMQRLFWDTELWRIMGAYTVDCLDNFAAIARDRAIRFERDGLVMIDLAEPPTTP